MRIYYFRVITLNGDSSVLFNVPGEDIDQGWQAAINWTIATGIVLVLASLTLIDIK